MFGNTARKWDYPASDTVLEDWEDIEMLEKVEHPLPQNQITSEEPSLSQPVVSESTYEEEEGNETSHIKLVSKIPFKEKMYYLLFLVISIIVSSFLISRYSLIAQYNYEIEGLKGKIITTTQEHKDLEGRVLKLSSHERIKAIAEQELGMSLEKSSVRIITLNSKTEEKQPTIPNNN